MESLAYWPAGEPQLRYWTAYRFVFASPKAWMNLLLGAVCMLIPIVGPIVLMGYMIEVAAFRLPDEQSGYPDFDFGRFVEYLTAGVWPFLVTFLVTLVLLFPLYAIIMLGVLAIVASNASGPMVAVMIVFDVILVLAAWAALLLILEPITIRAALLREFTGVFDFAWVKDFIRRTWRETLLSSLFLVGTSIPLVIIGYALCFIGMYPAMALQGFARWHLLFQVYSVYLARGGAPVPVKPFPVQAMRAVSQPPPLPQ